MPVDRRPKGIKWEEQPLGVLSDCEIARQLGVSQSLVSRQRAKRGIPAFEPEFVPPAPPIQPFRGAVDYKSPTAFQLAPQPPWLHRLLVVPDVHAPYHDELAWQTMLAAARIIQPTIVVVLGDFFDCYSVSEHSKDPRRASCVADELAESARLVRELDELRPQRKVFIWGNHEHRIERQVMSRAPALKGMVRGINDVLGLRQRGWELVSYRDGIELGDTYFTHDLERAGQQAVRYARIESGGKCVIGHVHKLETMHIGDKDGRPLWGRAFGWLGGRMASDYRHARRAKRDYHHGFGYGFMCPDGIVDLHGVPIVEGRCQAMGRIIRVTEAA